MEPTPRPSVPGPSGSGPGSGEAPSGWYLSREGQTYGPYGREQLEEGARTGHVAPTDQLWHAELGAWRPASAVFPELREAALPVSPEPGAEPSHRAAELPEPAADESDAEAHAEADAEAWKRPLGEWSAPSTPPAVAPAAPGAASEPTAARPSPPEGRARTKTELGLRRRVRPPFSSPSHDMAPLRWSLRAVAVAAVGGALTAVFAMLVLLSIEGRSAAAKPSEGGRDLVADLFSLFTVAAWTQAFALVVAGVLVVRWLVHARENLPALAEPGRQPAPVAFPPGLAGLLARPQRWLVETWLESDPPAAAAGGSRETSVWLKWALLGLFGGALGAAAAVLSRPADGKWLGLVLQLGTAALVLLGARATSRFAGELASRQDRRNRELVALERA